MICPLYTDTMEYGKVVVTPGYPIGLDLIVGRYQLKLQHILSISVSLLKYLIRAFMFILSLHVFELV